MEYLNNTSSQITRDRTMLLMNGFDQELNKVSEKITKNFESRVPEITEQAIA